MTNTSDSHEPTAVTEEVSQSDSPEAKASEAMQDYYRLQQELFTVTLVLAGIIFFSVWIFYNFNIALNYLLGACTGVVYLRMLGRDVEQLGDQKQQLSKTRFAVFIGLIIISSQWNQLQILPIFLGFLTYKAAIVVHMLRTLAS